MRYPEEGKTQSLQGKFLWTQQRDMTEIELYSPLGQTLLRLAIAPGQATLEAARGQRRTAANADALTRQALGWPLPVDGLRYWLQGFARTGQQVRAAVAPSGPDSFRSDGWLIRIAEWQAVGETAMPRRVDLERDDVLGGAIALRILIDDWRSGD